MLISYAEKARAQKVSQRRVGERASATEVGQFNVYWMGRPY